VIGKRVAPIDYGRCSVNSRQGKSRGALTSSCLVILMTRMNSQLLRVIGMDFT